MVEPEMAFFKLEDLMAMEEQFISTIVQTVLHKHRSNWNLERDITELEKVDRALPAHQL